MLCFTFLFEYKYAYFDSMSDTYCLSLHGCIYCLRESFCVVFMLKSKIYLQVGFTKLMPDKCGFVKLENNIIGVPAMQSADDVIDPRRCKTSLVGLSAGLSVLRSPVRFRPKLQKSRI